MDVGLSASSSTGSGLTISTNCERSSACPVRPVFIDPYLDAEFVTHTFLMLLPERLRDSRQPEENGDSAACN